MTKKALLYKSQYPVYRCKFEGPRPYYVQFTIQDIGTLVDHPYQHAKVVEIRVLKKRTKKT